MLAASASAVVGCIVPVEVGFAECKDDEGNAYEVGASFKDACGNDCQCDANGNRVCTDRGCPPPPCPPLEDGTVLAANESAPAADGCNTCTCNEDGTLLCTTMPCPVCDPSTVPVCPFADVQNCKVTPFCTEFGWICKLECLDCTEQPPPVCPPPMDPSCWWNGPICEGGQWSCGELVCDGCLGEPPPPGDCPDPMIPGCWSKPFCDFGMWTCVTYCNEPTCDDPMNPPPDCYTGMYPECVEYPICTEMGWVCQTDCFNCDMMMPPECFAMNPDCAASVYCDGLDWLCIEVCQ